MKLTRLGGVAAVVTMGMLALGCRDREEMALGTERERQADPTPPATPYVPPATPYTEHAAPQPATGMQAGLRPANQIAQARCEQMQRCGNIAKVRAHRAKDDGT